MRLVLLIAVAVLIVAGAAGSYYHYQSWRENRYDDLIIEAAKHHDVDPALVKALIKVQTDFNFAARIEEDDSRGLLLVPKRVALEYLEAHEREAWGYICMHRHFRNHDPNKPEEFTSDKHGTCKARGCNQRLIDELRDPETNLEIGCWYLGKARRILRIFKPDQTAEELRKLLVVAYRWGLPERGHKIQLTRDQRAFLHAVLNAYEKYKPNFERRARRAMRR